MASMNNICTYFGGRRFVLAVGCGVITSFLCYANKIDGAVYATVIISTLGAYISGNTYQKYQEIRSKNEPIQPD